MHWILGITWIVFSPLAGNAFGRWRGLIAIALVVPLYAVAYELAWSLNTNEWRLEPWTLAIICEGLVLCGATVGIWFRKHGMG